MTMKNREGIMTPAQEGNVLLMQDGNYKEIFFLLEIQYFS
jgi:hypothetical protein